MVSEHEDFLFNFSEKEFQIFQDYKGLQFQFLQAVAIFDKKLKTFIFIFFNFNFFFKKKKIFSTLIFHSTVTLQQYQFF